MYALVDKERPESAALTSYFRSREEAEKARDGYTMHKAGGITLSGPEYLDIVEIDRESRPCVFCGTEVESDKVDFCRSCFYTGTFHEERTPSVVELLAGVRPLDKVEHAHVWHTGGGCFIVGIKLTDGRLLTPSIGYRAEDGHVWPEPSFPEDEGDTWALVISANEEAFDNWDEEDGSIELVQELFTTEQLIERISAIA